MRGRWRKRTRPEAQREPKFKQNDFGGGLNSDTPASKISQKEVAVSDNAVSFPDRWEGRSGTQLFSNTVFPGSGTIHAIAQHPTSKKFVLHRGSTLYYADSAMASWTELKTNGAIEHSPVLNGSVTVLLQNLNIKKTTSSNTNAGTLYWNLVASGGDRTLNVYKDAAKTNLVSSGTRTGNGWINCQQQNNSGILLYIELASYTSDDTDSGNTITGILLSSSLDSNFNVNSNFVKFKNDFVLLLDRTSNDPAIENVSQASCIYLNMTDLVFYYLSGSARFTYGADPISNSGSEGIATPYGRRYLYTWSRIVDFNDAEDVSKTRLTGNLVFETPPNKIYSTTQADYGEHWFASAVGSNVVSLLFLANTFVGSINASPHLTHVSLYATLDIGVNGLDPQTQTRNNREIYVWVDDIDITKITYTDTTSDAVLRARLLKGFGLKTRFWKELPGGSLGVISSEFLYKAKQSTNKIYYGQLLKPEYLGFYNPAYQEMKVEDGIQDIRDSNHNAVILCTKSTYISNPLVYSAVTGIETVFALRGPKKIPGDIGVIDYGSSAEINEGAFISHCSDHTIRIFSGMAWGADLAGNKISRIIETLVAPGSVGAYISGVYLLWYKNSSSDTIPTQCLRLGLGGKAGVGWSKCTGADFPFPPLYLGALVITDANSIQRLLAYDSVDDLFHWVETFTSRSLTKYYKDKVAVAGTGGTSVVPKLRPAELTGPSEDQDCIHAETHISLRPSGSAYVTGMTMTARAYVDGASSATGSISGASLTSGDIQFFERVRGKRIQLEFEFSESGQQVVQVTTDYQAHDTSAIENGPGETLEAANQLALATDLRRWLTRPSIILDRGQQDRWDTSGVGTVPTATTGPDSSSYALNFVSAAYQYWIDDSSGFPSGIYYYNFFSIMFFIKDVTFSPQCAAVVMVARPLPNATNYFQIIFTSNTNLRVFAIATNYNTTIDSIASGWHHFAIVRTSGTAFSVYQNGVLKGTFDPGSGVYGGASGLGLGLGSNGGGSCKMYDFRIYTAGKTAADVLYLYNDIASNSGNKVLPMV